MERYPCRDSGTGSSFHHPITSTARDSGSHQLYNKNLSLEYLTGYLIEYSLSVDNIFVIIMIFISFNIQPKYYQACPFLGHPRRDHHEVSLHFCRQRPDPAVCMVPLCFRGHAGWHRGKNGLGFLYGRKMKTGSIPQHHPVVS